MPVVQNSRASGLKRSAAGPTESRAAHSAAPPRARPEPARSGAERSRTPPSPGPPEPRLSTASSPKAPERWRTNRASAADRCQLPKRGAVGLLREQKRKWPRGRERRGAERLPGSRRTRRVGPRGKMATGRRGRASSTVVSCTPRPQGRGPRPPKDGAQGCCASRSQLSFKPPCPCFLEVLSSDPTLK